MLDYEKEVVFIQSSHDLRKTRNTDNTLVLQNVRNIDKISDLRNYRKSDILDSLFSNSRISDASLYDNDHDRCSEEFVTSINIQVTCGRRSDTEDDSDANKNNDGVVTSFFNKHPVQKSEKFYKRLLRLKPPFSPFFSSLLQ